METIELGDKVRDRVTGFEGIVIGISAWLHQETSYGVRSQKLNEKGHPDKAQWFYIDEIEITGKNEMSA